MTLTAQYALDRFGKFPGTVPSILALTYLQAHHLDLDFCNHHFSPGAYLRTHADHVSRWHGDREPDAAVYLPSHSRTSPSTPFSHKYQWMNAARA